jgi:hypothetical protein
MSFNYSASFNENTIEWDMTGTVLAGPGISKNILLKRVWVTRSLLSGFGGSCTSEDLATFMDDSYTGGKYIRTILPSELGDFMLKSSMASEIATRYNEFVSSTGNHKPITGYYFYLDHEMADSFINYELVLDSARSIAAVTKSHTKDYLGVKGESLPVNTSVYSTYPVRAVIGGSVVLGVRAGDVIQYRASGGSGEYSTVVSSGDSSVVNIIEGVVESSGRIRIVKNQTADIVITISDSTDDQAQNSTLTLKVEAV